MGFIADVFPSSHCVNTHLHAPEQTDKTPAFTEVDTLFPVNSPFPTVSTLLLLNFLEAGKMDIFHTQLVHVVFTSFKNMNLLSDFVNLKLHLNFYRIWQRPHHVYFSLMRKTLKVKERQLFSHDCKTTYVSITRFDDTEQNCTI